MKIYISGKITGLPIEQAQRQFAAVAKQLYDAGHAPVNPMKLKHDHDHTWESYMKVDIAELLTCDAIYMLKGWHESKGACIEHTLATHLGIDIFFEYCIAANKVPHSLPVML